MNSQLAPAAKHFLLLETFETKELAHVVSRTLDGCNSPPTSYKESGSYVVVGHLCGGLHNTLDIMTHFCVTKLFSSKLPLLCDYDTQ
jgi:hypothetical protein